MSELSESEREALDEALWGGRIYDDVPAAVEAILAARAADRDAGLREALAKAWDEGKATGFSRAMRYMSDEPAVDTNPPNPYRDALATPTGTPTGSENGAGSCSGCRAPLRENERGLNTCDTAGCPGNLS